MQRIGPAQLRAWLLRAMNYFGADPVQFVASTSGVTTTLSGVSSFVGLQIGATIVGPNIKPGTTIVGMNTTADTITLSQGSLASGGPSVFTALGPSVLTCHLYQTPPSPHADPVVSDFVECTFDGYVPEQLTDWQGVFTNAGGQAENDSENLTWILNANPVVPNSVYGYWLDYPGGTSGPATVLLWESFLAPLPMVAAGNAVQIAVPLCEPPPGTVNPIP